nr:hypothetical protein [Tanacetum cinerariifolium]
MHTAMVPEQVKTIKIQAVIPVLRTRELKRQLQLWKRFGRLHLIVFVLVRNNTETRFSNEGKHVAKKTAVPNNRALTTIINLCLMGKTSGFESPRAPVLQILWGVVTRAYIDYAKSIWEEFTQSIHTLIKDKRSLAQRTYEKKKATLIVISSICFTKLVIYHLQRQHKFYPRLDSPLHLPNEELVLGYLKFNDKGTKREVFGMPIPAKTQRKKRKLTTKISDKPFKAMKSRPGLVSKKRKPLSSLRSVDESMAEDVPAKEPHVDDEEADMQRELEESLKSMYDVPRGPLPPVVIRKHESGKYQPLPEVSGKRKEKVIEEQVARDLLNLQTPKKKSLLIDTYFKGAPPHLLDPSDMMNLRGQGEGQAVPDPGAQDEGWAGSNPDKQAEGHARTDPGNAEESQPMPSLVVHAGSDCKHMDLDVADTGDITMFMDWFCKRRGITELKPQDLEGSAFEIIKVFHPDKPLPLGGPPGQVTIQSDFFFNKDLEYLRYDSKGSIHVLSISKMKAEKSMNRDHSEELAKDLAEARPSGASGSSQVPPPPPPPPSTNQEALDEQAQSFDDEDIGNAHIPKAQCQKPLPLGGPPGQVTIQSDFFFNKDLEYLRYDSKGSIHVLSISKMKAAYYPDVSLEQIVSDQIAVRTHIRILSVVRIEVFSMYGYDYMKKIVLCRTDLNEHIIAERDFKYLYPSDFEDLYLLNLQGYLNHLPPKDKKILTTADRYGVQMIMRFNEIHKFSDGTQQQTDEALDYRVKEFKINRMNPGLNTSLQSLKPKCTIESRAKRSSKIISLRHYSIMLASSHTVKSKTDIKSHTHYPCVGFNSLVYSFRALSTLRRSGLRMASTTAKPYQGDSSEFYLITGILTVAAAGQRDVNSQLHAHTLNSLSRTR